MKDLITKRKRVGEFKIVALTQECSQLVLGTFPPKLKDSGNFTIPCNIGEILCGRELCHLGVSINLMPSSIFKKLEIRDARPTIITLQLADRSISYL